MERECMSLKWLSEWVRKQIRHLRTEEGKKKLAYREMIKDTSDEARAWAV